MRSESCTGETGGRAVPCSFFVCANSAQSRHVCFGLSGGPRAVPSGAQPNRGGRWASRLVFGTGGPGKAGPGTPRAAALAAVHVPISIGQTCQAVTLMSDSSFCVFLRIIAANNLHPLPGTPIQSTIQCEHRAMAVHTLSQINPTPKVGKSSHHHHHPWTVW